MKAVSWRCSKSPPFSRNESRVQERVAPSGIFSNSLNHHLKQVRCIEKEIAIPGKIKA